jgi:glutaredoxin
VHDEQLRRWRAFVARQDAGSPYAGTANTLATAAPPAPSTSAAQGDDAERSTRPPSNVHVIVYTTSWCPSCRRAKQWMNANGVAYEEHDIERSSESARKMRAINPRGSVPTFDVEGQVEVGFSAESLLAAMRSAADRRRL